MDVEDTAALFTTHFRGREGVCSTKRDRGGYEPVEGDPDIEAHLSGDQAYGFYLMRGDNTVLCSCADIDDHGNSNPEWVQQTDKVCDQLQSWGVPYVREVSQSGSGSHIWVFFDEPVPAYITRSFWRVVSTESGVSLPEIYPRQDQLTGQGLGNLVLYPLWNKSSFVDDRFEVIDSVEALSDKVIEDPVNALQNVVQSVSGTIPLPPRAVTKPDQLPERVDRAMIPGSLLEARWNGDMSGLADRSRSALCFSMASICVKARIPTHEIEQTLRAWAVLNDYTHRATSDWIERTVIRSYDEVVSKEEVKSEGIATLFSSAREALVEHASEDKVIFRTGIKPLDASIDGCYPGEFVVIGGRPSNCKTAMALHIVDEVSKHHPCLIISQHMSRRELGKRAILAFAEGPESEWDLKDIEKKLGEHYAERRQIYAVENASTIERCEELIDQYVSTYGVKFVAIDYLQLLGRRKAGSGRYEDITDISRRLKQLAGRLEVAIVALCQLNRGIEARESQIPALADIKESGQIEQDADLVLIVQWPDRSKPDFRVWCLKRRNGPIRHQLVQTTFDAERQRFDGKIGKS